METILKILQSIGWLADPAKHFILAFSAGALVYSLTSTISYALISVWEHGNQRQANTAVVFYMAISCLLLGICAALLSHSYLDQLFIWYTTPLGPPLELVLP